MPYLALDIEWHDPAAMAAYRQAVAPAWRATSQAAHARYEHHRPRRRLAAGLAGGTSSGASHRRWSGTTRGVPRDHRWLAASTAKVILVESFDAGVTLP
ncbi:MAG: hypothetical protein U0531_08235 [Dehalococcoidia bacterium]